MIKAKK